ncbi:MAG: SDR family oxidoreductase [Anaerolineales bacterium]|jgi:2'-hydroxyisoflavone reductase|nr:MAG: SDR family oxidoreductase [Anaerolineales bacterium]
MKILILGGTRFLGRHLVNSARARRHEVTLFNRGQTNPELFQKVKKIRGDREQDLDQLAGQWDAVIDTCGYLPRLVRMSAEALKGKVGQYVFISSISAYESFHKAGIRESDPVGMLEDETTEQITGETYGPLKALCERAAQDVFGINSLIIRPGLVVGPHDPTDRFTYWVSRIARGGDVLAPEGPNAPTQIIDVRDLADFILQLIEQDVSGVFNVTGETVSLETVFQTCKIASGSDAHFKWAPVEFLKQHQVNPWSDMPAWLPDADESRGFARVDISKALQAGLEFTPLLDTVRDTLAWASDLPDEYTMKAGLKPEREKELLELLNVQ